MFLTGFIVVFVQVKSMELDKNYDKTTENSRDSRMFPNFNPNHYMSSETILKHGFLSVKY